MFKHVYSPTDTVPDRIQGGYRDVGPPSEKGQAIVRAQIAKEKEELERRAAEAAVAAEERTKREADERIEQEVQRRLAVHLEQLSPPPAPAQKVSKR